MEERLGLLQRRKLGLTIPALVPVVKELQAQGQLALASLASLEQLRRTG